MPAAVHRSADEREPWNPAESVTPAEALVASTDGQPTSASEAWLTCSRSTRIPLARRSLGRADRRLRGMPPPLSPASPNRGL